MNNQTSFGRIGVAILIGLAVVANFHGRPRPAAVAQEITPCSKQPAPAWELNGVDGRAVKSSDFMGKVVVLDFWATWCPPCRTEIPSLVELQNRYGDKGLTIVGVSLDEEGPPVVQRFMQSFKMNYPVVMGDEKVVNDFGGIEGIPTMFIIDREGQIVSKHIGLVDQATLENAIKSLL